MHLGLVLDGLAVHDVVPPLVDGLVPVHLLAGTTYHQDVLHGSVAARELGDGTVHGRLECGRGAAAVNTVGGDDHLGAAVRSEEHTSELKSLMRISNAVICL